MSKVLSLSRPLFIAAALAFALILFSNHQKQARTCDDQCIMDLGAMSVMVAASAPAILLPPGPDMAWFYAVTVPVDVAMLGFIFVSPAPAQTFDAVSGFDGGAGAGVDGGGISSW